MNIDSKIMSRPNKRATYEEMAQYLNEHHAKDNPNYILYEIKAPLGFRFVAYNGVLVKPNQREHYLKVLKAEFDYVRAYNHYLEVL